ncbi:MAG: hypothetical protein MZV63_12170 [Marinilabiliales bacterium]|nr:hypothetical protein [Marinilabiliales bacterium]
MGVGDHQDHRRDHLRDVHRADAALPCRRAHSSRSATFLPRLQVFRPVQPALPLRRAGAHACFGWQLPTDLYHFGFLAVFAVLMWLLAVRQLRARRRRLTAVGHTPPHIGDDLVEEEAGDQRDADIDPTRGHNSHLDGDLPARSLM